MRAYVLLLAAILISSVGLEAQILTKQEKKELKKEVKAYKKDIDSYKMMKEEQELNLQIIDDQAVTLQSQELQLQRKNQTIKELNDTIALLRSLINKQGGYNSSGGSGIDTRNFPEGTVYQVQVGVFKHFDIREQLDPPVYFRTEEVDGLLRYSVGWFDNYEEAQKFKDNLRKMGLGDAFVTQYEDGQRTFDSPTIPGGYSKQPEQQTNSLGSTKKQDSVEINTGYQSGSNNGGDEEIDESKYEWIIVTDGKGNTGKVKRLKDDN